MRIHVISPGFASDAFEAAPVFRVGVDKLISIHAPYPDKEIENKVEKTIAKIEETLKIHAEKKVLREKGFNDIVKEIKHLIEGFGDYDEIYLHLEGGERHIGLAMAYAAFFVKKKIHLVFATEYGNNQKEYRFEDIPPIPAYKLSKKQEEILRLVADKDGQTLTELSNRINAKDAQKVAPGVLRQLKALSQLNLITFAQNGKKAYSITPTSRLFL